MSSPAELAESAFVDIADAVTHALHARLRHPPPPVLYHYTDLNGLRGIIGSGIVWASHHRFLNDTREGVHGDALFQAVLCDGLPDFVEVPRSADEWRTGVRYAALMLIRADPSAFPVIPHVVSLTVLDDDLPQWRGYGANGSGFALGFDTAKMELDERILVERVEYDVDMQRDVVRAMLDVAANRLSSEWSGLAVSSDTAWALMSGAAGVLFGFAPVPQAVFKDRGFRSEEEWRIVVEAGIDAAMPTPRFAADAKVRGPRRIPYFELQLRRDGRLPLAEVVTGPALDPAAAKAEVEAVLVASGYDPAVVRVRPSSIPYRP
ncbi:MAG: DUF2971 domain-containing protein [Myxococcota bacterium]